MASLLSAPPHILYTKVATAVRRILVIGENRLLQHNLVAFLCGRLGLRAKSQSGLPSEPPTAYSSTATVSGAFAAAGKEA
jgi:hypothetical protein